MGSCALAHNAATQKSYVAADGIWSPDQRRGGRRAAAADADKLLEIIRKSLLGGDKLLRMIRKSFLGGDNLLEIIRKLKKKQAILFEFRQPIWIATVY